LSSTASQNSAGKNRDLFIALILSGLSLAYFSFWIFHFYPTLINDEYAALDWFYRSWSAGHILPSPHKVFKPYSLALGFLTFGRSPLALELLTALFAAGLVFIFFLTTRQRLDPGFAMLATIMLIFVPDLFDDTVVGNTTVVGAFFLMLGVYFGLEIIDRPERWKRYSIAGFWGGFIRIENCLLAIPLLWWLFPKNRKQILRWVLAPAIIGLSAVIWFAKDWVLNKNFLHAMEIAKWDVTVGSGPPHLGLANALFMFSHFVSLNLSKPFSIFALAAFSAYGWEKRKAFFREPLAVIAALTGLFFLVSFSNGLYPQLRYFIFIEPFLLFYACRVFNRLYLFLKPRKLAWAALALTALISLEYFFWAGHRLWGPELRAMRKESSYQKSTIRLAEYFRPLLKDKKYRLLISDHRDDQLSWLLRELPGQDYLYFQEMLYYKDFQKKDFLAFEPEWICWLADDYHYEPVKEMFAWMGFQDRTELNGYLIQLVTVIGDYRVFRVSKLNPEPPGK